MGRKDKGEDEKITDDDKKFGADIRRYVKAVQDGDSKTAQDHANQLRQDYGHEVDR